MRIALSMLSTKLFPSPIWPAFAADAIALTVLSTGSLGNRDFDLDLRQKADCRGRCV
jgi:hypothetical protein